MSPDKISFTVKPPDAGQRLDVYLSQQPNLPTRSQIQSLIEQGLITVGGQPKKAHYKLVAGDRIEVTIPPPRKLEITPQAIPLDILFEDEHIIVINKPAGMVVHPAAGNWEGTLVHALLHHCPDLTGIGGVERPGIVHRLDKGTSGVMVAAKSEVAHQVLSKLFKAHQINRKYIALVHGCPKAPEGTIDLPLGRSSGDRKKISPRTRKARRAVTHYRVLESYPTPLSPSPFTGRGLGGGVYSLLELTLETGRTHQIRVHLAAIGHPVVGDTTYGRREKEKIIARPALHAQVLGFNHPVTGKYMEFKADMPQDMEKAVKGVKS
jgi:23S rRNA pseudouridine1911/1915/1917 synthase